MNIKEIKKSQKESLINYLKNNKLRSLLMALISLMVFSSIFVLIFVIQSILSFITAFFIIIIYRFMLLIAYSLYNKWALQIVRGNNKKLVYKFEDIVSITFSAWFSEIVGYSIFIIPGLFATANFTLKYFVYFDYRKYGKPFVVKESSRVLRGWGVEFFKFLISFLPLLLFSFLTCGIGLVYFMPYFSLCSAKFYDEIRIKNVL